MHVAFSASIKGAGIVAGGPYACATQTTYTSCMYSGSPSITKSISNTKSWSGNQIDDIKNLAKQKVYMISGTLDTTVGASVMNQLYKYYVTDGQFIPSSNVEFKNDLRAAHTFPTDFDSTGNNGCGFAGSPYISNCAFDGAGAILNHIYGPLQPRNDGALSGTFIEFDQGEFLTNPRSYGMSQTAWIYVPRNCANGETCKLHIAYHGCLQGYEKIGDKYVKNTGYNRWADTNNIIILYPQAVSTMMVSSESKVSLPNMNGCWDWIGWYGNDFDVKSGKQLSTMKKIIDRIVSGFNPIDPPTELQVTNTTNNSVSLSWIQVSGATSYNIYRDGQKVNNPLITNNTFTDNNLNSGSTYKYTVTAVSSSGSESLPSNSVTAKTSGQPPNIPPPTGLAVTDVTSNSIALRWEPTSIAEKYNIYRNGIKIGDANIPSYTDNDLSYATEYNYQVTAVNGAEESAKSTGVAAKTLPVKKCFTDSNYNHVAAGRATQQLGYCYANGSNEKMGLYNIFIKTHLCETNDNYYVIE
jgi:chitodextrinase